MSVTPVPRERWSEALEAERAYWMDFRRNTTELARSVAEKAHAAAWLARQLPQPPPQGEWLEVGIGVFGIGCIHFLPYAEEHSLVGVDPLPLASPDELAVSRPLVAAVEACRSMSYTQIETTGEETGFAAARFSLACCYNVLDQVRDPLSVLREIARVLTPGGVFFLGCNTVSRASLLKYALYGRRQAQNSVGARAHTFRFRERDVLSMLRAAYFDVIATKSVPRLETGRRWGKSRRLLVLARSSMARPHN